MTDTPLHRFLSAKASEFNIPGSAIAVFADGEESYAFHGTTSVEDARPLDGDTLFHFGSITKTYTATAIMRLVAEGKIDLDAPVRRYLPGFRLSDEDAAAAVTITHLLNHTAGWSDYLPEGGDGSLGSYVAGMAGVPVETPPGRHAAYKNAGFAIAGLIMESLTGTAYEEAMRSLVLDPVGLTTATFMTRKPTGHVAMGHAAQADGTLDITTDWVAERYADPSGGIVSTIGDQLRWARFHLSDGADVLPRALLVQMQQPTTEVEGDYFGDGIGLGWFLRTTGGVRTVGHGGSMVGQYSWLLLVPERNFAVVTVATAGPNGIPYNQDVVRWALETYLGVVDRDPEPLPSTRRGRANSSAPTRPRRGARSSGRTANSSCSTSRSPPKRSRSSARHRILNRRSSGCSLTPTTSTSSPADHWRACAASSRATPRAPSRPSISPDGPTCAFPDTH